MAFDAVHSRKQGSEHPYLFFSSGDIPALRERFTKEPFATRWKIFLENADYIVEAPVAEPGDDIERWTLGNAGTTAFAYAITGERKYADRAIKEALAAAARDREIWSIPKHYNKGAALETSGLNMTCALVYDWCYDAMSEEERGRIRDALLNKGLDLYLVSVKGIKESGYNKKEEDRRDWWVDNTTSNWAGVVHGGAGVAALVLWHESEKARCAVEYARKYIPRFLKINMLDDGDGHEGIMYSTYGREWALYFLMASSRFFGGDEDLFGDMARKLAGYWEVYLQGPDGRYANFNNMSEDVFHGLWSRDCIPLGTGAALREKAVIARDNLPSGPISPLSALYEALVPGGDRLLLWAADNGGARYKWMGVSPFYLLWRREDAPSLLGQPRPELQDTVLFRGSGYALFRSDKLWMAYNAGWTSDKSHHNKDLGTFVLVVDGERVINDPGYGDVETWQHSTVLVNGGGQFVGAHAHYLRFGAGNGFRCLASDLSQAYTNKALTKCIRHVVMVRDKYIVILDDVAAASPITFESRLQTRLPVRLQAGGAVIEGKKNSIHVLAPAPADVEMTYRRWAGKRHQKISKTEEPPAVTYIGLRTAQRIENGEIITVLYPVQAGEAAPHAEFTPDGILKVTDSKGIEDTIVFRRNEGRWGLMSVNNEDASKIPTGKERTLKPFRKE